MVEQQSQLDQLKKETEDASLKKVITEIEELEDKNNSNDKIELDWILTTEFSSKLSAKNAQTLLNEINGILESKINDTTGLSDLKNFLEMVINKDNNNYKSPEWKAPKEGKEVKLNKISWYEHNLIKDVKNPNHYANLIWNIPELQDTKKMLDNITTALNNTTKDNIQRLQQLLYDKMNEKNKKKFEEENKKGNHWTWEINSNLTENLSTFLDNTMNYIKDHKEWKDVAEKHDIMQEKQNAEINPDNIKAKLRWKWNKEWVNIDWEKKGIAEQLNSYVEMWDSLPNQVQTLLQLTKKALETETDQNTDKSEEILKLEKELAKLWAMPEIANDGNNWVDWKFGDKTYNALINYIEKSLKNSAEISPNNMNAKLRWKWNKEWVDINQEKQKIADNLNQYTQIREVLPGNVKDLLIQTKKALESKTNDADQSNDILVLEKNLAKLWAMPEKANNGNNWVDWKFGDKTYDALINYIEKSLKNSAEIDSQKINVTLRWEWKDLPNNDKNAKKEEIANKLNSYTNQRENLSFEKKHVLLLSKAALESTSRDDEKWNPISDEVLTLEKKLVSLWVMPNTPTDGKNNSVDWKFGTETYRSLLNYLDSKPSEKTESKNSPAQTVSETTEGKKWPKTLKDVFDALLNIDWQSWWWFGWFLNNIKNRFNALTWWTGNIDKFKDNNTIDFDNQTVKDVLAQIQTTKDIIWIKTIKKTLETGKEKDIRELQMALWTPDNWLNITGKIDEQTAKILKKYIENEDNKWSWDNLEDQCLKGFQKENDTAINIWEKIQWFIYAKTDWYWQTTRILKWTIDWKACIAANINYTAGEWNNSAKISGEQSIIQYLDWTKEVWKFDGDLKLIEWTRYSGGKKEKVPATANQNTTDGASSGATGATTTPATETTKTAQQ